MRYGFLSAMTAAALLVGCGSTQETADEAPRQETRGAPTHMIVGAHWSPTSVVKSQAMRAAIPRALTVFEGALPERVRSIETSVLGREVSAEAKASEECPTCVSLSFDVGTTFGIDVPLMDEPEEVEVTSRVGIIAPIVFAPRDGDLVAALDLGALGEAGGGSVGAKIASLPMGLGEDAGAWIEAKIAEHVTERAPMIDLFRVPAPSYEGRPLPIRPGRVAFDANRGVIYGGFTVPGAPAGAAIETWSIVGESEQAGVAISPALVAVLAGEAIDEARLEGDALVVRRGSEERAVPVSAALSAQAPSGELERAAWEATSWLQAPSYASDAGAVRFGLLGVVADSGALIARYGARIAP